MTDRRAFLAGALALLAAPLAAEAQRGGKVYRIGALLGTQQTLSPTNPSDKAFLDGLQERGYVLGQNLAIEVRTLARESDGAEKLVASGVDVIYAPGTLATLAAKKATSTVPIVFVGVADPVGDGLVASVAWPGGNATGLTTNSFELSGKRVELIKELLPEVNRIAVLGTPGSPPSERALAATEAAARVLGLQIQPVEARKVEDLPGALTAATRGRAGALIVLPYNTMFLRERNRLAELALAHRLPLIGEYRQWPDAGGFASYGANLRDQLRRAGTYIDRILKGAKPADLPVEQPTTFELVINLKTAKALGLTIPPSVLARADEVIQ